MYNKVDAHIKNSCFLYVPRISPGHSVPFVSLVCFSESGSLMSHVCSRDELDKSYEIVIPAARPINASSRHTHQAPSHLQVPTSGNPNGNGHGSGSGGGTVNKQPPTAPRAHKKPRLSEARASPATSVNALPRVQTQTSGRSASRHIDSPEDSPLQSPDTRKAPSGKADTAMGEEPERVRGRERERERARSRERGREGERRSRHRSPAPREPRDRERNKERDRDRDRERERDRPRERERDRDRTSRRGGGHGRKGRSGGGGGGGGGGSGYSGSDRDRTLAERMGL